MWSETSEKLKNAINNSALKNAAVPIFICDESLTVCSKSAGAERLFPRPAVRNSIAPYLSEIDTEKLRSGAADHISASFSRAQDSSYCLITWGNAWGIGYFAVMIEPMIRFCPPVEPWYINESASGISKALKMLLEGEKPKTYDLQTVQTRLCRLCSFVDSESSVGNVFSSLNRIMDFAVSAAEPILHSVHASLIPDPTSARAINISESPTSVYMMTATMIAAAVMLSADGRIGLSYSHDGDGESATVAVTTSAGELVPKGTHSYAGLIVPENPLSMELAAMSDMADANGFCLDAVLDDGNISLTVKITAMTGHSDLGAPEISGSDVKFFAALLTDMLAILDIDR